MRIIESIRGFFKPRESVVFEQPRIGVIRLHPMRCWACHEPLTDGDVVVSSGPRIGHGTCMVLVKDREGRVVSGHPSRSVLFLYQDEWERWQRDHTEPVKFRWVR